MPNYDDIINLKRHVSKTRKPMSIYNRSAQFAPFSALKGYQEKINEITKITNNKENQTNSKNKLAEKKFQKSK